MGYIRSNEEYNEKALSDALAGFPVYEKPVPMIPRAIADKLADVVGEVLNGDNSGGWVARASEALDAYHTHTKAQP